MSQNFGKKEWVELFRQIGLTEAQMTQWHQLFEQKHPESHLSFLTWLGIDEEEIGRIRQL